jgi:hypothetical protein
MIDFNAAFVGMVELSLVGEVNAIDVDTRDIEARSHSPRWPPLFVAIAFDTDEDDNWKTSATILPPQKADPISELHLEHGFDVMLAMESIALDDYSMTDELSTLVVPSLPSSRGVKGKRQAIRLTVDTSSSRDKNGVPIECCLDVKIESA